MKISRADQRGWKKWGSEQTIANPRFQCALWLATTRPPWSSLLDLDMRV